MFKKTPPKIVMVEDNTSHHPLFTKEFEDAGFIVIICPNVDAGFVDDVAGIKPDIISMDIMIGGPGLELEYGGLSAIRLLKQDERTSKIPIIVLSNFFEENKVERARSEGAIDFISLQGHAVSTIPGFFLSYLENPKKYKPVHPFFQPQ